MAEVGVLNLTIHDNSDQAASGLTNLAGALSAVKKAVKGGLNLGSTATQLEKLSTAVSASTKSLNSIGTFLNAVASYTRAFKDTEKVKFNAEPIEQLKTAIGDGIKIGNAGTQIKNIRDALSGEWDTAGTASAAASLNVIATAAGNLTANSAANVIKNVAKAMNDYVAAASKAHSTSGAHDLMMQAFGAASSMGDTGKGQSDNYVQAGYDVAEGFSIGIQQGIEAAKTAGTDMASEVLKAVKDVLGIKSPSKELEYCGEMAGEGFIEGLRVVNGEVQIASEDMAQTVLNSVEEVVANIDYSKINLGDYLVSPLQSLREQFLYSANASKQFSDKMQGAVPALQKCRDVVLELGGSHKEVAEFSKTSAASLVAPLKDAENEVEQVIRNVQEDIVEGFGTAGQSTMESIEDKIRARREALQAENQQRLEANYEQFRELFMSGEQPWKESVPEMYNFSPEALEKGKTYAEALRISLQEANGEMEKFVEATNEPAGDALRASAEKAKEAKQAIEDTQNSTDFLANSTSVSSGMQQVADAAREMNEAMHGSKTATRILTDDLKPLDKELKEKKKDTKNTSSAFEKMGKVLKGFSPLLAKIWKQFKKITLRRALTAMIRSIASGFKEGVENVYNYSKLVGTSLAPTMDAAASSIQQFKNSLGAAASPLIQALVPALQTVVNWLITAINYFNQFFSLLNGQKTWTRALPATTTAFKNQEKAAKGAGAAIKDLLADWDELNIIQSESGGGGGGSAASAAEDYLNMFEEVSVFEGKIKDLVNFIKDNFDTIKTIVAAISAGLLAWKVSNGISEVLKAVDKLKGGIVMAVVGFTLSAAAGASFADNGLTVGNVLMAIGGLAAAGFGGYWVGSAALASLGLGAAGGAVGAIAGVAIALAFMINSYQVRSAENAYGSLEEDADTIRKNVMSYFNPKVTSEIDVVKARIKDEEDAKKKVEDALTVLERDYPIAISLKTEETLKTLSTDVSNLVAQANALILLRKQNIRIPIIASGQYENADSLLKFSDEQWDATSEYVTKLGERIGELISKGITDGAELDGLQQRLSNIVRAITYGQTSGEFVGKMSLASANLRNNGYTKSTVSGYIETYKQERQNIVDAATAAAVTEKADLKALYAAVEERYKNHEATYAELRTAAEAYKKFDVNKEAERYIKEWLAEGDSMFVSDLAAGLKKVMESNKNAFLPNAMNAMINMASSREYGYGSDAEEYIENLRDDIYNELSRGTGFSKDELSGILGLAGIDPMSLLPDDFGDRLRKAIAKRLEGGGFTETDKEKIISEFGLTIENTKETVERTKITAPSVDTKPFDKSMTYIENAALNAVNYVKRIIESLSNFSVNVSVTERNKAPEGGVKRYMQTRASGGFVRSGDLVMANENGNFELMGKMGNQPVVANNQQIISGISQGVATANGDVVSELRALAGLMQKMLNKEFVAKAIPGSDWGQHNSRSNDAWSKVNG